MVNIFLLADLITGSNDPAGIQLVTEPVADCDQYNSSHLEADLSVLPWSARFAVAVEDNLHGIAFQVCGDCKDALRIDQWAITADEETAEDNDLALPIANAS